MELYTEKRKQITKLTFTEIESVLGIPIDHAFLKYKKELMEYGYQVGKISMKNLPISVIGFRKYTVKSQFIGLFV